MGLTNYSHWGSAGEMRHCMQAHPDVEAAMLGFAQRRMRTFTHVGTTDRLYESAAAVAAAMDRPLSGPAYGGGENQDANVELGGDRRAVPASTEEEGEETSKGRNGLAALHRAVRDKRAALKVRACARRCFTRGAAHRSRRQGQRACRGRGNGVPGGGPKSNSSAATKRASCPGKKGKEKDG